MAWGRGLRSFGKEMILINTKKLITNLLISDFVAKNNLQ